MLRNLMFALAAGSALAGGAVAETFDVEMLNRGEGRATMVFKPDFIRIAPGDTLRFVPTDRGHNAQADSDRWPEGAPELKGRVGKEVEYTFDQEGLYGVKCMPHFAMGMVMTVAVGDVTEAPEGWLAGRVPRSTKARYEAQLEQLSAAE